MIDLVLLSTHYDSWLFAIIGWSVSGACLIISLCIACWGLRGCMGLMIRILLVLLLIGLPPLWFWNNEAETESDRMNCIIEHLVMSLAFSPLLWTFFSCSMEPHESSQNEKREKPQNPYSRLPHRGKRVSKELSNASRRHRK